MKQLLQTCLSALLLFAVFSSQAQPLTYSVANAHSHNDYLNEQPFQNAFKNSYGSIEADIFPVKRDLFVAHDKEKIQPALTLTKMYLDPLLKELKADTSRRVKLLVDIKEDYKRSLKLLTRQLKKLKPYLSRPEAEKQLIILISGTRPAPAEYKHYPDYIFFDDDLKLAHTPSEWERVGQVSLEFSRYAAWEGKDSVTANDRESLQAVIDSVHLAGKTIRFWGAPDNEASWKLQTQSGADLVGTDKIDELAAFLRNSPAKKSRQ